MRPQTPSRLSLMRTQMQRSARAMVAVMQMQGPMLQAVVLMEAVMHMRDLRLRAAMLMTVMQIWGLKLQAGAGDSGAGIGARGHPNQLTDQVELDEDPNAEVGPGDGGDGGGADDGDG